MKKEDIRTKSTVSAPPQPAPQPAPVSVGATGLEQHRVEESRYYLGAPAPEPFREEHFIFPEKYGKDRIVLLIRDPYWTHAYWEINQGTIDRIRRENGDDVINSAKLVLRVKDIQNANPDKPNSFFDIEIAPGARNWYINVMKPNTTYCVEIGYRTQDGRFIMIARSNYVVTPRAGVSEVLDEEWMSIEEMYALSGGLGLGLSSAELRKRMKEKMEQWITSGVPGSMFSPWKKKPEEKGFYLWVDTELIVYGATVPDAKLTIQGVPKKLNPDGSFSARFALPNGTQVIPIIATSSDNKDTITITPVVNKETK